MSIGSLGKANASAGQVTFRFVGDVTGFANATRQAQNLSRSATDQISRNFREVGRDLARIGIGLSAAVSAPLAAGVREVIRSGSDFESAFAGVQKTVDATEQQFAVLEEGIRSMALELPAAATQIAGVAQVAGQLGIQVQNIEQFTETMIRLGESTNLTAEEAANQLARFVNITGFSVDEIDRLGSSLVALGNNFAATEAEILATSLRFASVGEIVGLTEDQILAFGTSVIALGINAEAGGSALQRAFVEMASAVSAGGEEVATFARVAGVSVEEFSRLFREDASAAMSLFLEGLGNLHDSGGDALAIMDELGISEVRLRNAVLALATGHETLDDALRVAADGIQDNTALIEESERRFGTFESQLEITKNRLREVGIQGFQAIRPHLIGLLEQGQRFIGFLEGMIEKFQGLSSRVQETILVFVGFGIAIGPILVVVAAIVSALGFFVTTAGVVAVAIGAIIAAGILLYRHWDDLKAAVESLWAKFEERFPAIAEVVETQIEFVRLAIDKIVDVFKFMVRFLSAVLPGVVEIFKGWGLQILAVFEGVVAGVVGLGRALIEGIEFAATFGMRGDPAAVWEQTFSRIGNAWDQFTEGAEISAQGFQKLIQDFGNEFFGIEAPLKAYVDAAKKSFGEVGIIINEHALDLALGSESVGDFVIKAIEWLDLYNVQTDELTRNLSKIHDPQEKFNFLLSFLDVQMDKLLPKWEDTNHMLPDMEEMMGGVANGARDMAEGFEEAEEKLVSFQDVHQRLTDNINLASDQIGVWEGKLGDVQQALEYLNEAEERNGRLTQEQQESRDRLLWYYDRLQNGINDDLVPAFISAVEAEALFQEKADEIRKTADEQGKSQEWVNEQLKEYLKWADPALAAQIEQRDVQSELKDVMGQVVEQLENLIARLDIIAGIKAEPDVSSNAPESTEEIKEYEDNILNLPDSKEVSIVHNAVESTEEMGFLEDNIINLPGSKFIDIDTTADEVIIGIGAIDRDLQEIVATPWQIGLTADADDAITDIEVVKRGFNEVDGLRGTITIDADISRAIEGFNTVAGFTPRSPAKEGPLAFTPSWDWLFEGLSVAAEKYTGETLETLERFLSVADSAIGVLGGASDLAQKLQIVGGVTVPAASAINAIAQFTEDAVTAITDTFVGDDTLPEHLTEWVDFASTAVDLITQGLEAITSLNELEGSLNLPRLQNAASAIKFWVEHVVKSIGDTAEFMVTHEGVGFVGLAGAFSEQAGKAVELVGQAVEVLSQLNEAGSIASIADQRDTVSAIKFWVEHLVKSIGDTAELMTATEGGGFVGNATAFAGAATPVVELVGSAVEVLVQLDEAGEAARQSLDRDLISSIKFWIEHLVKSIGDSAAILGGDFLDQVPVFAEAAEASIGIISATLELIDQFNQWEDAESQSDNILEAISGFGQTALRITEELGAIASTWSGDLNDELTTFQEAVDSSVGILTSILELLEGVPTWERLQPAIVNILNLVDPLAFLALAIAIDVGRVADTWSGELNDELTTFDEAVQTSIGVLEAVLGLLEHDISWEQLQPAFVNILELVFPLALLAQNIALEVGNVARTWSGNLNEELLLFQEAVEASIGPLESTISLLESFSDGFTVPSDLGGVARQLSEAARTLAEEFADVALEWDSLKNDDILALSEAVEGALGALGAVFDFLQGFVPGTREVGSGDNRRTEEIPIITSLAGLRGIARELAEQGRLIAEEFAAAADNWDTTLNDDITRMAGAIEEAIGALESIRSFINSFAEDEDDDKEHVPVARIVSNLLAIGETLGQVVLTIGGEMAKYNEAILAAKQGFVDVTFEMEDRTADYIEFTVTSFEDLRSTLVHIFESMTAQVLDILENWADAAERIGENFIQGMIEGLKNSEGYLYQTVRRIVSQAIDEANDAARNESPSKLMQKAGENMGLGLTLGFEKGAGGLSNAVKASVEGAASQASSAAPILQAPSISLGKEINELLAAKKEADDATEEVKTSTTKLATTVKQSENELAKSFSSFLSLVMTSRVLQEKVIARAAQDMVRNIIHLAVIFTRGYIRWRDISSDLIKDHGIFAINALEGFSNVARSISSIVSESSGAITELINLITTLEDPNLVRRLSEVGETMAKAIIAMAEKMADAFRRWRERVGLLEVLLIVNALKQLAELASNVSSIMENAGGLIAEIVGVSEGTPPSLLTAQSHQQQTRQAPTPLATVSYLDEPPPSSLMPSNQITLFVGDQEVSAVVKEDMYRTYNRRRTRRSGVPRV